jgi:hypothetical protein
MTHLDRLIDDAARRMMAETPSGDFTAKTMARLGAQRRSRAWWRWAPAGAVAVVAVAAAAATLAQLRLHRDLPVIPRLEAALTAAVPPPAIEPVVAAPVERTNVMSAAELAWHERRLAPLAAPAPIERESIQPEPLAVPLLELKPLVTSPLALEPLDAGK